MFWFLPMKIEEPQGTTKVPLVNGVLIIINVLLFWFGVQPTTRMDGWLAFFGPLLYAFGHANALHLIGNMWFLLVFGAPVNRRLGNAWYLTVYLASALFVGLCAWLFAPGGMIGASGAISCVVILSGFLLAGRRIQVFYFTLFPFSIIPALLHRPNSLVYWFIRWDSFQAKLFWWALFFVPALEVWNLMVCKHTDGSWNWSYLGHLAGAVFGVIVVLLLPKRITHYRPANVAAAI